MASIMSRNSTEPSDLQDGGMLSSTHDIYQLPFSLLTVPPSLLGGPDNLVVKATETVSFCHQVQGTPMPSIQWEHNNKQLLHSARVKMTNDGMNVSLTLSDIGRLDEGVYTCTALNSLGSMSAQTKLVVLGESRRNIIEPEIVCVCVCACVCVCVCMCVCVRTCVCVCVCVIVLSLITIHIRLM